LKRFTIKGRKWTEKIGSMSQLRLDSMDYNNANENIERGYKWLENEMLAELEPDALNQKILKEEQAKYKYSWNNLDTLKIKLKEKYHSSDILPFSALGFRNSIMASEFKKASEKDDFWTNLEEERMFHGTEGELHKAYHFHEFGISSNSHFVEIFNSCKKEQTVEGNYWNDDDHVGFLRLAIAMEPQGEAARNALRYSIVNRHHLSGAFESSVFILALTELDYAKYNGIIIEGIKFLKNNQQKDGSWGIHTIRDTHYALRAICRTNGITDKCVINGLNYIIRNQDQSGAWGYNSEKNGFSSRIDESCFALLSLVQIAPPSSISYEEFKFKEILYKQQKAAYKPYFVHTSPIYRKERPTREIYEKIKEELRGAKENIRIISPYIDMYYEDIINIKLQNPNVNIRIITRPRKDIKGARERIAKMS
jgi:hypothetical protein